MFIKVNQHTFLSVLQGIIRKENTKLKISYRGETEDLPRPQESSDPNLRNSGEHITLLVYLKDY